MKIFPVLFVFSIAANTALLLVLRSMSSVRSESASDIVSTYKIPRSAPVAADQKAGSGDATHLEKAGAGDTWRELQTDNPAVFVARLRAAGFPPRVVHAIVSAVVNERFLAQREDIMGDMPDAPFWKPAITALNDPEKAAALNKLTRERDDQLRQLLEADAYVGDELQEVYLRRQYGDLPSEKMRRLQAVLSDYRDLRSQLQPPNEPVDANDREKLAAFDREMRADLAKLLTPQELEQYDLRSSPTASQLRQRLDAFRPTEEEYRGIFQLRRSIEERFPLAGDVVDPQELAARRAAEQQLESQLKAMLGASRFADYQLATSSEYRTLNQIVSRFDLPLSAARDVVAVQRDIMNRANAVRSNDAIPSAEKDVRMLALSREASAKLGAALTPRGLDAYKQYGGAWLATLKRAQPGAPR